MRLSSNVDDARARIIEAACRLFRHYGYGKTTVVDIASACAMSPANVYRYFPSKAAINETICHLLLAHLESELDKIATATQIPSACLTQMIECVARFTTAMYLDDRRVYDMVTAAIEENWTAIQDHVRHVRGTFGDIIMRGIVAGEFAPQDPDKAAQCASFALIGFWHPVIAAQCRDVAGIPTPATMTAFILSALRYQEPSTSGQAESA